MEERRISRPARTQQFLDTVALGSLLVFASVMPPRPLAISDLGSEARAATSDPFTPSLATPEPTARDAA